MDSLHAIASLGIPGPALLCPASVHVLDSPTLQEQPTPPAEDATAIPSSSMTLESALAGSTVPSLPKLQLT